MDMGGFATVMVILMMVIVAFAVVAWMVGQRAKEKREDEFGKLAASRGWQFLAEDNSYAKRWQGKPFERGGRANNIILGHHRNRAFCSFQYSYTSSSYNGKTTTTHTHNFMVVVVSLPAAVPEFSVGAEGAFGGKVAEAFGFHRINTGDDDFDNTFKINATTRTSVVGCCSPDWSSC
ncbi:hypothetical protein FOE78_02075 [Microlunatus elymi]|uniref:Uncharacterized protein n=1 Tax=Microlunatus elymi TaxID=2596828 RepID=A0A516PUI5_9ACTN|nr:hypothetical protein [Microlunatus elymi]QDP94866.1 hypothetical protein FOE78_02075 [Microlunatus elymi]